MGDQSVLYRVGNGHLCREITVQNGVVTTTALVFNDGRGRTAMTSHEIALVLDTARWRYDIPYWKWTKSGLDGQDRGFAQADFEDSGWTVVPHLHPIFDACYSGFAWFRHEFTLPLEQRGQPISITVGGLDDEDWTHYRIFLNGEKLANRAGSGRWRTPHTVCLAADEAGYGYLRHGARNVLAVEVQDLSRERPEMVPGEHDHYMFNGWLLDQYIAAGPPLAVVDDFVVHEVHTEGTSPEAVLSRLQVVVVSPSHPELVVTLSYSASEEEPFLRKTVSIHNEGPAPLRLLDVTLEDWQGRFDARRGGRGEPCLTDDLFFGIEHPAGVNMGEAARLRAVQMPGRDIGPGTSFASESVICGAAAQGQSIENAFQRYLMGLRPRRDSRLAVYDPLGWYDYTFLAAESLTEMTEDLVDENVTVLEDLRENGVVFDAYMFDDWWEPTDLGRFRDRAYPQGGAAVANRVRHGGMQPGLWFATTCAGWTCHQAPGMDRAIAGGSGVPLPPGHPGAFDWVELFTHAHTRDKRFCLAAEPYRTMVQQTIPRHVRDLSLACLKLDCVTLHFTSSEHDHRPGRHSVEAMTTVVLETVAAAQHANPELMVIWYWGFRSPWWLKYGDIAFDKGLKMEAASPASSPAPSYRQSVSLNVDQAIQHATLLPLPLQDSLGVWLGQVAWANRMGKEEEWRDAFLLDVARGSAIVQLWGDVGLLDQDDSDFLASVLRWMRANEAHYRTTIRIGGDAWRAEPYCYAQQTATGAVVTLYNPQFEASTVSVDLTPLGIGASDPAALYEIYPFPGTVANGATVVESKLSASLKPFEVRCVEVLRDGTLLGAIPPQIRPADRTGSLVELVATPATLNEGEAPTATHHLYRGTAILPAIVRGQRLAIVVRLHRNGEWWYYPDVQSLVRFTGKLDGLDVCADAIPRSRSYNGPGSPWVVYDIPAGASWVGKTLSIDLGGQLPSDVALTVEARIYDAWWRQADKRFAARSDADQPQSAD